MLSHHLRMSFRALGKQRVTSFINIGGLGLGIACFLLIGLFVRDELSYDRHHEHGDDIVRMGLHLFLDGTESNYATVAAPVAQGLKDAFPEVVETVRLQDSSTQIWVGDKVYDEANFYWSDPSIFDVFTIPLVAGDPATALTDPGSAVISASTAQKYFGTENPVGKTFLRNNSQMWTVSGVFEDVPRTSHFKPDLIASNLNDPDALQTSWATQNNFATYVRLRPGTSAEQFSAKLPALIKEKVWPEAEQLFGLPAEQIFASGTQFDYIVEPLTDIHLKSDLTAQFETGGSMTYVWLFSAIAIAILLIACINYINLSTAVSGRKAREVGVRKAVGSSREQLVYQFLSDSMVTTVLSVVLSLVVTWLALPLLNTFSGKSLSLAVFGDPIVLASALVLTVVVTLLAGAYPAFVLSSYRPALVLKGGKQAGRAKSGLRNGLIVFQYAISSALVLAALVVYGQLDYIQNKNLGFSGEQVVMIHNTDDIFDNLDAFKNQLSSMASVKAVSSSSHTFGRPSNDNLYTPEGRADSEGKLIWTNMTDGTFDDVYDLELVDGRFIDRDIPGDQRALVLNETAVRLLELDNPVGTRVNARFGGDGSWTVVGVVKDFHVESFDKAIKPFLFASNVEGGGWENSTVSVKLATDDFGASLAAIEEAWLAISGGQALQYDFFDDVFEERYMQEKQVGQILIVFSILAILIACLGLFGLAAFVTTQRTKEIGIRKSLGASASGIVMMLFKDFGKWVLVANLIAWPLAWWMMSDWLQQFVYRADIALWYFPVSLVVGVALAFLTIGGKTLRAAMANPVQALKYE
jgi:putative ABC transport system permease protein